MKPTKQSDRQVFSTIGGREIEMNFDPSSFDHLRRVLTDLYSDQVLAIIREYSTNARDSHIEAGNPAPIEVTTPTQFQQFFKVKDYGVGLSESEIEFIYSQYGASTKRESNEVTGLLGLGSKSALTYTNQFTLVGVKDGIKTVVSVSRDERDRGVVNIVGTSETDEPNGVEITVPANRYNDFKTKALNFFRVWDQGTVLLDGEEVPGVEGLKVSDDLTVTEEWRSYIVMGNVPYPVDGNQFDMGLPGKHNVVARVPIGAVEFPGTREALIYSGLTRKTLEAVKADLHDQLITAVQKEVDAATTHKEAIRAIIRWTKMLPKDKKDHNFKYRGGEIPQEINAGDGKVFLVAVGHPETDWQSKPYRVGWTEKKQTLLLEVIPDAIWVYNFKRNFTPACKKKLWMWCANAKRSYPQNFIMSQDKPTSPWIKDMVNWDEVEPLKLPVNRGGREADPNRIAGSYDIFIHTSNGVDAQFGVPNTDIDTSMPIYWCYADERSGSLANCVANFEDGFTLVYFSRNRQDKFLRLFPEARRISDVIQEYREWFLSFLSDRDKDAIALRENRYANPWLYLKHLPSSGVNDPEIRRLQQLRYHDEHVDELVKQLRSLGVALGFEYTHGNPFDKYLLMDYPSYGEDKKEWRRQAVLYLNAVYNATKG